MTIRNRVSNKALLDSGHGKDQLLIEAFNDGNKGLTLDKLVKIRGIKGALYDKVFYAANVLCEVLIDIGVQLEDISSQITGATLAALVTEHWTDTTLAKQVIDEVSGVIADRHRKELQTRREAYNFQYLPAIQLFREQLSIAGESLYHGNLYEARFFWNNFQPSRQDFSKNIKLPLSLGFYEAFLLGVFWADGHIYQSKSSKSLNIIGNRKDFDLETNVNFYLDIIIPLLREVHNFREVSGLDYVIDREKKGDYQRTDRYQYPSIEIHSSAICTWLINDLGFAAPATKMENVRAINIPIKHMQNRDAQIGFFSGILAAMGTINTNRTLSFQDVNKGIIDSIRELAESFGYHPSDTKLGEGDMWYIYFPTSDLRDMSIVTIDPIAQGQSFLHAGLFFNRKHINVLNTDYFR